MSQVLGNNDFVDEFSSKGELEIMNQRQSPQGLLFQILNHAWHSQCGGGEGVVDDAGK